MLVAVLLEDDRTEIRPVVCDDAVWHAESMDDVGNKLHSRVSLCICYCLSFDPFCKLVDGYQQKLEASMSCFERPNHIEHPYCKGPGERNSFEGCSWYMQLLHKPRVACAFTHNVFSVARSMWPEETMVERLSD